MKDATLRNFLEVGSILKYQLANNIIVPRTLVPFVLAYFHLTSHAGTKKMRSYIRQKYFWPGMIYDIDEFAMVVSFVPFSSTAALVKVR